MRLVESRVLRKTFWTKMEEVTGNWAKLHVQEFPPSPQIHENKIEGGPGVQVFRKKICRKITLRSWGKY